MMSKWDKLKFDARNMESLLSDKIVSYHKYEVSIKNPNAEKEGLFTEIQESEYQIAALFNKYQLLIDDMNDYVQKNSDIRNVTIVQRQKEIIKEFKLEYNRTKMSIHRKSDRLALLSRNGGRDVESDEMDLLLKENESVKNSNRLADNLIEQAGETHNNLKSQFNNIRNSREKMGGIIDKLPVIGTLLKNIGNKKNKDNTIVAIVIAILICFCIWYLFH
ncbi:hypothetical protein WA158_005994 [Blastocystis sp. Blastoise]